VAHALIEVHVEDDDDDSPAPPLMRVWTCTQAKCDFSDAWKQLWPETNLSWCQQWL